MTPPRRAARATPRQVADRYVEAVCDLDPIVATSLGNRPGDDRLPDLGPAGLEAEAALIRETLAELDRVLADEPALDDDPVERRCARLLRERLGAELAAHEAGEGLPRAVQPVQPGARRPPGVLADARRRPRRTGRSSPGGMARVPEAYRGFRETLEEGARRGLLVAPRQVTHRRRRSSTSGWPARTSPGSSPPARTPLRAELDAAAQAADAGRGARCATSSRDEYAPQAEGTPDAVGRERYALAARRWTGSDLGAGSGLEEAYAWGWAEHRRILAEQRIEAEKVLPGATPMEAMRWLGAQRAGRRGRRGGPRPAAADDGRRDRRPGRHALRPRRAGAPRRGDDRARPAAPPRRTTPGPAQDFSRPGPHLAADAGPHPVPAVGPGLDLVPRGRSRPSPAAGAVGLRLAGAVDYQTSLGSVGANVEGWALYAERLMDELGYFDRPRRAAGLPGRAAAARRCGWSSTSACTWACRSPTTPRARWPTHRGEPWTPELARAFLGEHCGADLAFLDSELVRYLGIPGQAISYKLGERAWLAGREARAGRPAATAFDLKAWHMAALSQGSLGLDDLADELAGSKPSGRRPAGRRVARGLTCVARWRARVGGTCGSLEAGGGQQGGDAARALPPT